MTLKHTPVKNHRAIANKLADQLRPSGWYDLMKGFLVSEEFEQIIATLDQNVLEGKRFTPSLSHVFSAFTLCPLNELRVVLVNNEPYNVLGLSNGTAFGTKGTTHKPVELFQILRSINESVYYGKQNLDELPADLNHWAAQGVLLLNVSLTTEIGKPGKHVKLWNPFITYMIDMLNVRHPELAWIFMGNDVSPLAELLEDGHLQLFCHHPNLPHYAPPALWDCNNVFNTVNRALNADQKAIINW